jgi:hypothetical protein
VFSWSRPIAWAQTQLLKNEIEPSKLVFDMRDRVVAYRGMRLLNRVSTYPRIRCDMETYRIDPRSEGDEIANGEEGMSPPNGMETVRGMSPYRLRACVSPPGAHLM